MALIAEHGLGPPCEDEDASPTPGTTPQLVSTRRATSTHLLGVKSPCTPSKCVTARGPSRLSRCCRGQLRCIAWSLRNASPVGSVIKRPIGTMTLGPRLGPPSGAPPGPGPRARENFPGARAGAGGPPGGAPAGAPRDPPPGPHFGPVLGVDIYIFACYKGVPRGGSPGGALWGPPGGPPRGAKKCTFFWVFNNSPSRDSLGPFFGPPRDGVWSVVTDGVSD